MLIQHVPLLSTKRIVLASASPRRAELLRGLGLKIEIFPSTFEEDLDKSLFANPGEYAKETATRKAHDVYQKIQEAGSGKRADLIIAADTVVELGSQVLEKPRDVDDARRMLSSLSGQVHKVYTGVALVTPKSSGSNSGSSPLLTSFYEGTEVEFAELEEQSILAYIASEEPMDKAGAYGIQVLCGSGSVGKEWRHYSLEEFFIGNASVRLFNCFKPGKHELVVYLRTR